MKAPELSPEIIFVSTTKIGENTTNILTAFFQNAFTLWHIKRNIYIRKTEFTSHLFFYSLEMQRRLMQTKLHKKFFNSVCKETTHNLEK